MKNDFDWYEESNALQAPEFHQPSKNKTGRRVPILVLVVLMLATAVLGGVLGSVLTANSVRSETGTQSSVKTAEVPEENQAEQPRQSNPQFVVPESEPAPSNNAATVPVADRTTTYTKAEVVTMCQPTVVGLTVNIAYNGQTGVAGGSGVIISSDGYIVTNNHVVENAMSAQSVKVLLSDNTEYDGEILGMDANTDLAVIKINATNLPYAIMGDSGNTLVGEDVVVIGNPIDSQLRGTVTSGIISGLNRERTINGRKMTLMQTDAAINQGNSGGGMFNMHGELIGIVNSKISTLVGEGVGFAIPVNKLKEVVNDLIDVGYVTGRAYLGIYSNTVTVQTGEQSSYSWLDILNGRVETETRVMITEVISGSAAESAGLQAGDLVLAIDGESIRTNADLSSKIAEYRAGDEAILTIQRDNAIQKITVTFGQYVPQ